MFCSLCFGRIAIDNKKFLRLDVLSQFLNLPRLIVALHKPKIEDGILVLDINTTVYAPKRAVSMERLMREAGYAPPDRLDLE